MGFVVGKVALGQVSSEYFGFPCQFSYHRLLHTHHLSTGAGTIGQLVADVPSGLSLTPPQETKKKAFVTRKRNRFWNASLNLAFSSFLSFIFSFSFMFCVKTSYTTFSLSLSLSLLNISSLSYFTFFFFFKINYYGCLSLQ
jgi:hypothetical protein